MYELFMKAEINNKNIYLTFFLYFILEKDQNVPLVTARPVEAMPAPPGAAGPEHGNSAPWWYNK